MSCCCACAVRPSSPSKKEDRPPRRDGGLRRSLVHGSTQPMQRRERCKRLARGGLGPLARGVGSRSPGVPRAMRAERRLARRTFQCRPKEQPRRLFETVGAGARKSACFCNLLWWSIRRQGSSDLVGLNFPPLKLLLTSVESRIVLEDETAESGAGLPERGARMNVRPIRSESQTTPRKR